MHGADVLRHVLAGFAVAARGGLHQHAVFVTQVDRKAIELQFSGILDRRIGLGQSQFLAHPRIESQRTARFSIGFGADRQHRHHMPHFGEGVERRAADPPGRRVGRNEFGVFGFERLQFAKQPVVFRVGNRRLIEDVVSVIVTFNFLAQRSHARQHVGRCHQENRRSARREPDGTPRASMRS